MKVLIMGIDGYIGWPLALRLMSKGHQVYGLDNFVTRRRVKEVSSDSLLPLLPMSKRIEAARAALGGKIEFMRGDASNPEVIYSAMEKFRPDAIVHLAEQRSAPYSMIGLKQAIETMNKNIISTMNLMYAVKDINPDAHIVKLGTMGEYGTPNIDIPEGFFEIEYNGRKDYLPFPKFAGSWYHWTKVHDTNNLMFGNKLWNTKITDVMQGVVYGTRTEELSATRTYTRFDIDEVWGTALNRFCAQSVAGLPITPYGKGGQTRGFLSLEDSIQCLSIAIDKPPEDGEYRVFNQFDEHYSVLDLSERVSRIYEKMYGKKARIEHVPNPRVEKEEHYYNPEHSKLRKLGYKTTRTLDQEVEIILSDISDNRRRLDRLKKVIMPRTFWRESSGKELSLAGK